MKTFHFRHETLLVYRKNLVKLRERELGEINTKTNWFAARLASIRIEMQKTEEALTQVRLKGLLDKQRELLEYLRTLRATLPEMEKAHRGECAKLTPAKERVEDAIVQRKIIENLKKKHYTTFQRQQAREEEFQLDEFRSTRTTR